MLEHFPGDAPNRNLRILASRADLPLPPLLIQSEIDKSSAEPLSLNQVSMHQVQQALPCLNVQRVVQLARRISTGRLFHKALAGIQQRSVCGKPDAAMSPQATCIKPTGGSKGIILAAMGVACQVR